MCDNSIARAAIEAAVEEYGLSIAGRGVYGGSSLWMRAPDGTDTADVAKVLKEQDVLIEPGEAFFAGTQRPTEFYRLGYSSIPKARIEQGIKLIAGALG